jgi:hypothetical protein
MPCAFSTRKELEAFVLEGARLGFDDPNVQRATMFAEDLQVDRGTVEVFALSLKNMLRMKGCNVRASATSLAGKSQTVGDLSDAMAQDLRLA